MNNLLITAFFRYITQTAHAASEHVAQKRRFCIFCQLFRMSRFPIPFFGEFLWITLNFMCISIADLGLIQQSLRRHDPEGLFLSQCKIIINSSDVLQLKSTIYRPIYKISLPSYPQRLTISFRLSTITAPL